jgi:hypothetical protein
MHGNGGNRLDGLSLIKYVCTRAMSLCVFDFSGSGKSEGEFVTLGKNALPITIKFRYSRKSRFKGSNRGLIVKWTLLIYTLGKKYGSCLCNALLKLILKLKCKMSHSR